MHFNSKVLLLSCPLDGEAYAYAQRMEIEETFRDLKNHRWGFALRYARTTRPERLQILLLIGALATLMLWMMGLAAQTRHWARHFQANTVKHRNVLSTVFLGQQLWRSPNMKLNYTELIDAFERLPYLLAERASFA